MRDLETALEHLQVIRRLMEQATVYRTVTVPTALAGGALALLTSLTLYFLAGRATPQTHLATWLAAFALVNAFHHGLIWRTTRTRDEPYLSAGLGMALKTMSPPLFVGGLLGIALGFGPQGDVVAASLVWTTFYGLALLATHAFSPRSLRVLGLAFTATGSLGLAVHWAQIVALTPASGSPEQTGAIFMGITFGLFHLIYGGCVRSWQRAS